MSRPDNLRQTFEFSDDEDNDDIENNYLDRMAEQMVIKPVQSSVFSQPQNTIPLIKINALEQQVNQSNQQFIQLQDNVNSVRDQLQVDIGNLSSGLQHQQQEINKINTGIQGLESSFTTHQSIFSNYEQNNGDRMNLSDNRLLGVEQELENVKRDNIRKELLLEQEIAKVNEMKKTIAILQPIAEATKDIPAEILKKLVHSNYYKQMKVLISFYERFTRPIPTKFEDWETMDVDINRVPRIDGSGKPIYIRVQGMEKHYRIDSISFRDLSKLYGEGDEIDINQNTSRAVLHDWDPEFEYKKHSDGNRYINHRVWKFPSEQMKDRVQQDNRRRLNRLYQERTDKEAASINQNNYSPVLSSQASSSYMQ